MWAQRRQAGAEDAWAAAQEALARVRELLKSGDERKARDAAVTFAVLCDKSGVLESAARVAENHHHQIAEQQATAIADLVRAFFEAVDVPFSEPVRKLLAAMLREGVEHGGPFKAPAGEARAARLAVRSAVRVA